MKSKMFVWSLVVIIAISMSLIGVSFTGCKKAEEVAPAAEEEEAAPAEEEEAAPAEEEEAEEEVAEEAPELGTESSTYWIEKAGIIPSGELNIYSYKEECTESRIAQEFMEAYPDVKVNWVSIPPAEFASKLAIECETGTAAFDCFWTYPGWTVQFSPFLEDVTDRIPEDLKNDILPTVVKSTAVDDKWFGIPLFNNIMSIIYLEDVLEKAGYDKPPETWDEFFECAEASTVDEDGDGIPEVYGISWELCEIFGLFNGFDFILSSVGGSLWNKDKDNPQATFNNEKGARALQIEKRILGSDFSDPAMVGALAVEIRRVVASGKAAMGIAVPGSVEALARKDFPENVDRFGYSLMPHDPGFETVSTGDGMGFVIRKDGNVDAALAYCLFYVSPEMQKFMSEDYGFPCVRNSVATSEEYLTKYPFFEMAAEQAKYETRRYYQDNVSLIQDSLFPIFQNYFGGSIDEDTALSRMEEAFNEAWE